jgi:gluconolactonase
VIQVSPSRRLSEHVRDPAFVAHHGDFEAVLGDAPRIVRVLATDAHEGPVYASRDDALYFTTLPRRRDLPVPGTPEVAIKRLALDGERFPLEPERVTVVRADANSANGMALDGSGRLVVCEQGSHARAAAVTRVDRVTGEATTLVDSWNGLRLNSPNDVVVRSDGSVWFTDPGYGHLQGFRPEPLMGDFVYRFDPATDRLSVVADAFDKPNGLAFSPQEDVLYVTDSGANQEEGSYYVDRPHHIKAFDVVAGRRLANERIFAVTTPGFPDGVKVDAAGRVYASSSSGVQVFNVDGDLIGEIRLPGAVNFVFGGPDRNVLFITADDAIWAAVLNATAPQPPKGA